MRGFLLALGDHTPCGESCGRRLIFAGTRATSTHARRGRRAQTIVWESGSGQYTHFARSHLGPLPEAPRITAIAIATAAAPTTVAIQPTQSGAWALGQNTSRAMFRTVTANASNATTMAICAPPIISPPNRP